ncbi:SAM-dependent methyltransferase [Fulvivirga sedimenti]|uniref:Class I SAM-dependent methyltransferase n=1 Tax=Fulvivirga sedimenti TaxID=2879465 RepID=A0A9X1HTY0_9BACT|nr:class I SAM-dependent methyltransferase [Fulvivirga sedimenti]MCA6078234.1 class I SAM-dependent methyltransferase [Fulvivirga sedimenti]
MTAHSEWFSEWFDSPYYYMLYFQRDDADARSFIDALVSHVQVTTSDHILDLACGRGRHAIYLNKKGFNVTGLDLSPQSIAIAREFENSRLHFDTHDMRRPLPGKFNLIMNLFTSFGYFETDDEHLRALENIADGLVPGGCFILDFMNARFVKKHLVKHNTLTIGEVKFDLERRDDGRFIEKDIRFETTEGRRHFKERVRAFTENELESLISRSGMRVIEKWGNYGLGAFDPEISERLILYCKK